MSIPSLNPFEFRASVRTQEQGYAVEWRERLNPFEFRASVRTEAADALIHVRASQSL